MTYLAEQIKRADKSKDAAIVLDHHLPWEPDLYAGRSYYATVLSFRKQRWRRLVAEFQAEHGRAPPAELNRLFQHHGGERDFQLLKKGLADFGKDNYFTDEDLFATAAAVGLRTGRPVTILTGLGHPRGEGERIRRRLPRWGSPE